MKYTAILAFAAGAFAIPQASITSAPAALPIPSGLSPQLSCALSCSPGDVTCAASCLGNARPNASQAIDTNKCAAQCDQGDGSAAAAAAYARCVDGCINSLFPSSQTAFGGAGVAAGSSVAAGATASGHSVRPTGTTSMPTGSAAEKTGAADANSARFAGAAGLAGMLAIFAL